MRALPPVALAGLVALGACAVEMDYAGTNFACDSTHWCPEGQICLKAGYCAGPDWRCGRLNVLADDFDDGWRHWVWVEWHEEGGARLSEEGGQAVATPAASGGADSAAWYQSGERYLWTDSRAYLEVPQSVSGVAGARAIFAVVFEGDDAYSIEQEEDQLYFRKREGGVDMTLGSVRYDPAAHRWWQIRGADGRAVWETSPDAFDWAARFEEARPDDPGLARIRFGAAAVAGVADPGAARFDNVNGGASLGRTCRAQDAADDFEGSGTDGWLRSYESGGASRDVADGAAVVALSDAGPSSAAFVSSSAYSLVDSGLAVQVLEVPAAAAGVSTWLAAVARNGDALTVRLEQETLYFEQTREGATAVIGTVLYEPTQHRFWGIGHRDGEVRWSTSPDGSSWTAEVAAATPFDLESMTLSFGATATASPAGGAIARFDDAW